MSSAPGKHRSIPARLVALVLAVLVPTTGLHFVHLADGFDAARAETLRETQRIARALGAHIDDHLRSIDGLLHTVSTAVPMQPGHADDANATLSAIRNGLPKHFGSISVIAPNGAMLYSAETPPPASGSINVADRDYFRLAMTSNHSVVGQPIVSRTSGKPIVVMARAVRAEGTDGAIAVVTASTRLDHFLNIFSRVSLPEGSVVTVVNQEGLVLTRSRDPDQWIGKDISALAAFQRVLREGDGAGEMESADGLVRLSGFARVTAAPWLVYVGVPSDTALADARSDTLRYGALAAIAAILAVIAATAIGRTISRPLRQLQRDAAALSSGQLEHRSHALGPTEVQELAESFNSMAGNLAQYTGALRDAEIRYRTTFELAAVGIAQLAPNGQWLRVNQRLCEITGYPRDELLGLTFQDITHPDDLDTDLAYVRQVLAGEIDTYTMDKRYRRKDGTVVWINLTVALVRTTSGEPDYFISVIEDIDRRKRAEALLDGQRAVLEQIARGMPVRTPLETLLHTVEAQSPDMRCSILLIDSDGIHVRHGAAPRLPEGFIAAIDGAAIGPHAGSCGTAAWRGKPVIVEDIESDPLWDDYRSLARQYGLRACWSTPIFDPQRNVIGTFAIYYDRPGRPTEDHLGLIAYATQTAAIALTRAREDERIRTSEMMLRQYVAGTPAAVAMLDTQLRYLLTSRRWITDFRLQDEDIIGRSHFEVFPEVPERWREILRRCVAGATERAEADPFPRPDGKTDWVRWEVQPWYRAEGSIGGIMIFSEVITERVEAEQALRDVTHRLGAAVRGGNVGLWDWDLQTNAVFYSREWKRQLGYDDDEITNDFDEWRSRLHPDDVNRAMQAAGAIIAGTRPDYSIEFRMRHRDGSYRWIFSQGSLQLDEDGVPIRLTGSHIDITEQRRLHAEKLALGEQLSRLLESIAEGFIQIDEHGDCRFVNRRASELLGIAADDLAGQNLWDAVPELVGTAIQSACARTLQANHGERAEQYHSSWGRWLECRVYALDHGATLFLADITARKATEEALQHAANDLRALSARLSDAQEAERRAIAIELHDQVGQNLTALNLTFSLLKGELPTSAGPTAAARIDEGMELVSETVARVRDLMVDLRPPMLDDYGLLAALRWYAGRFAARSGIDVHVDGHEPVPRLPGRAEIALFRIAQEALNNVLKHAAAKHVLVTLDSIENTVELAIADDGHGFDTTAQKHNGVGWGIAGMRERARAAGSHLSIESTPGDGTRVTVSMDRS